VYWIIIAVLALILVFAYLAGVRQQQGWGGTVMVLCVVGLILVALDRAFFHVIGGRRGASSYADSELGLKERQTKLIIDAVRDQLPPHCRVFAVRMVDPQGAGVNLGEQIAAQQALDKILGKGAYELVGEWGPEQYGEPVSVDALSRAVEEREIDLLISYAGLPENLEEASFYRRTRAPKVGAYFPGQPDRSRIRSWLLDGLLQVAVLEEDGKLRAYTSDNLP